MIELWIHMKFLQNAADEIYQGISSATERISHLDNDTYSSSTRRDVTLSRVLRVGFSVTCIVSQLIRALQ
jgi:hypothetical protein